MAGDGRLTLVDEIVAGTVGGLAGGLIMTAVMTMGKKTGMIERPLPLRAERWAEEQAGVAEKTGPQQEQVLSQGMHLGYSALLGAGYGALRSVLDAPAIPSGPLYGLSIYALNLGAIFPALNLTKGPLQEEPMTVGRRMMMHVAFGMAAGLVSEKVRERMAAGS
jgi:uncharacterized membrane protein YagU involved in acid resistance